MNLQGLTSEFSLPELFKFLQESQQTGRLSLKSVGDFSVENKGQDNSHFFWFSKGRLLAVSNRLDGLGLLHTLQVRSLVHRSRLSRLLRQCPSGVMLGTLLIDRGILTGKQLKSLFASQVLRHTCALLKAPDAKFAFHASYPLPYLEMTGVNIRATDVTLPSLRILKNWDALKNKLPDLASGLKPVGKELATYQLQTQEKDVLLLAQKGMSLSKIAKALKLPALDVQKTGFRLIFVGLVKEIPLIQAAKPAYQPKRRPSAKLSESFLGRLSGYLQKVPLMAKRGIAPKERKVPVAVNAVSSDNSSFNYRQPISSEKTARNSAVKRLTHAISGDRAERLSQIAPSCLLTSYPSCLLTKSVVRA